MNLSQEELELLAANPMRGINLVVNGIEDGYFNGLKQINSKAHPAVLAYTLILGTASGFFNRIADATSELHAKHARNISQLSRNMSSQETYGLFADAATSTLMLALSVETFMGLARDRTEQQGQLSVTYKELLVPKDTIIPINGYDFSIMNGIRILYNERSGWNIIFDSDTNNPLSPISSNLIEPMFKLQNDVQYLMMYVPVLQMSCKGIENITANSASGCSGTYNYTDHLYGIRAFLVNSTGMTEIVVAFDQAVFDPLTVTLACELDTVNKRVSFEIPDVYISNGLGVGTVRIYTYTTKGALVKDLKDVSPSSIVPNYQDYRYGLGNLNEYSAPFRNASNVVWQAVDNVKGGRSPTSFVEMKQRVIDGRQIRTLPITEKNVEGVALNNGYSSVLVIDYVTGRQFALSGELPYQSNKDFLAPMSCYVGSYLASIEDLLGSGVAKDNGDRVTVPHNVLFDISQPTSVLVNNYTKEGYLNLSSERKVDLLANKTLVYTPFYYVLDVTDDQVSLRTYNLDTPLINYQTYVRDNPALGLGVGVGSLSIAHREDGYTIYLTTKSDNAYKQLINEQLGIQLSISPPETSQTANLAGKLISVNSSGERNWEFYLDSRFDVDLNDLLYFNNFNQFGSQQDKVRSALATDMTFIFCVEGDQDLTRSLLDPKIDGSIFPEEMVGILETTYNVTFGKHLKNMYSRIRPLVGEAQYKRYSVDVPATYEETKYVRVNGQLQFDDAGDPIVEYRKGDIMYGADGITPTLKYRAGIDVVYENGLPVELEPRKKKYHWDFVAFDGNYFFSKDEYDIQFAADTKRYFTNTIIGDMERLSSETINQTNLFFQPRSKLGYQQVVINSNYEGVLRQDLSFVVTYYLTESGMRNAALKATLAASDPKQLNLGLYNKTTISTEALQAQVSSVNISEEVVAVKLSAMAGDSTVDVISNLDNLTGFSIRKRLELTSDGLLGVKESVDTIFQPHDIRMRSIV
jgi:hypothetical protein